MKTELLIYDSFIKIWNSEYDLGLDHLRQFLKGINKKDSKNYQDRILNKTFLLLLSRKQFHSVLNIFETKEFNLKNKLNPIYYALMHYLKDEYPNEILKMGEELKQPVEDIMKRVEEMAIEYK